MKKLFLTLIMVGLSSLFAAPFSGGEEIVDEFIRNGRCVKCYQNKDNIWYMPREFIFYITVDENDMTIYGKYNSTDEETDARMFKVDDYIISLDEESNIILNKK